MKSLLEFLINNKSTGIVSDPNFVDLGLSVIWAKCNIGAENETDYGHYYQWGGLEPMDDKDCDWISTPFNNGEKTFDKKYFNSIKNEVCPNGILSKEYDIAFQTYKGNVYMPTPEQIEELIKKTKNEWITNYNDSGVNGKLFTGKNNNTIFIPAAGNRMDTQFSGQCSYASIWSSGVSTYDNNDSRYLYFNKNYNYPFGNFSRCYGLSVRAVKEK